MGQGNFREEMKMFIENFKLAIFEKDDAFTGNGYPRVNGYGFRYKTFCMVVSKRGSRKWIVSEFYSGKRIAESNINMMDAITEAVKRVDSQIAALGESSIKAMIRVQRRINHHFPKKTATITI